MCLWVVGPVKSWREVVQSSWSHDFFLILKENTESFTIKYNFSFSFFYRLVFSDWEVSLLCLMYWKGFCLFFYLDWRSYIVKWLFWIYWNVFFPLFLLICSSNDKLYSRTFSTFRFSISLIIGYLNSCIVLDIINLKSNRFMSNN